MIRTIAALLMAALSASAARAGCWSERECASTVAQAESQLDAVGQTHSAFDNARTYHAQAQLLTAVSEWDAFRAKQIRGYIEQIDRSVREAIAGDGTLSVLLASKAQQRLILDAVSGSEPLAGDKHVEELLAGLAELKQAGEEVNAAILQVREQAAARKQSLEAAEVVREELVFRQLGHERRSAVVADLASIYDNRSRRMQLAAERGAAVDSIQRAAEIRLPSLSMPELEGAGAPNEKEERRIEKQAARILAKLGER